MLIINYKMNTLNKEKPPIKGAVSRVKPLQSWVRFDYMAYRAVTSCKDRYKEKKISPSDCVNFPLSLYVVSSNLLPDCVTFVMGVCKVLTDSVNSLTQRLMSTAT